MPNLNFNQVLAIILAVLGVIGISTAQLTDLFGPAVAKTVVSACSLISSGLSAILVIVTGQSGQLKAVQDMPGVERIVVNKDANQTLAAMAVDTKQDKIVPAPGAAQAVAETAAS